MAWVNDSRKTSSMLWLRGSAGVGKSSLAQTIAELCSKNGCLAGSFFFSRTRHNRADGRLLIATLSYQLTSTFPAARSIIKKTVQRDPMVLQQSLEVQMKRLFVESINRVARSPIRRYITHYTRSHPRLVVIDGLDECSDPAVQCEILRVLSSALQSLRLPFRFLIASRPQVHITCTFNQLRPNTPLREIDLSEDTWQVDSDIRTFLEGQFNKIKEMHPLRLYLPHTWPTYKNVDELVRRSSGQFIYASVVMRYIASPNHRPVERLNIILGLSPRPVQDSPFTQLDELYTYILGCVGDIETVLRILGILVVPRAKDHSNDYSTPKALEKLLGLQPGDIELLFNDVLSIIAIDSPTTPIRILHSSFADFLLDPSRADTFYVNIRASHAALAGWYIKAATKKHESSDYDWDPIITHVKSAALAETLLENLLNFQFLVIFYRVKSLSVAKTSNLYTSKSALVDYIWGWITEFLSCFDSRSMLFDRTASEKIHTQLLLHLDTYLKNQLAHRVLDEKFMDMLALVTTRCQVGWTYPRVLSLSYVETADAQELASWYPDDFSWDVDEVVLHVVLILSGFMRYSKHRARAGHGHGPFVPHTAQPIREEILVPLRQFLLDPERSGDYFVNGEKFARTALRCLRRLYRSSAASDPYEQRMTILCINTRILLSKAAITKELVAFLTDNVTNHALLKSNFGGHSSSDSEVDRLATEIEAYLKHANESTEHITNVVSAN